MIFLVFVVVANRETGLRNRCGPRLHSLLTLTQTIQSNGKKENH